MYVYVCDFLVMLLLPTGGKRAMLTDGIEIQFTRKFIIVSCINCSLFIYSFSQITCVALGFSLDLKNARIQEVTCLQLHTKFIYPLMENVAIDIINHYLKIATLYCVYLYHLEKAIDYGADSLFSLAAS
jgi:hypothetical protein